LLEIETTAIRIRQIRLTVTNAPKKRARRCDENEDPPSQAPRM
jgi:hypothetical protein